MSGATDTLSGVYITGTLSLDDGTKQSILARRVPRGDGTTDLVVIDDKMIEFESRFAKTDTVPNDQARITTNVLDRKVPAATSAETSTRIRLVDADLGATLGNPDRLIAQGKLDDDKLAHLKAHPSSATVYRRLCIIVGGKWAQVAKFIPCFYPDPPKR